jgi:hypothetical protein
VKALVRDENLVSGVVWWGFPKKCSGNVPEHKVLAKDDKDMPASLPKLTNWGDKSTYNAAYQIAEWATWRFLKYAFDRWSSIPKVCGPVVQYVSGTDRRKL